MILPALYQFFEKNEQVEQAEEARRVRGAGTDMGRRLED